MKVHSSEKDEHQMAPKKWFIIGPILQLCRIVLQETYTSLTNVASGVGKADPSLLAIVAPGWKKLIRR